MFFLNRVLDPLHSCLNLLRFLREWENAEIEGNMGNARTGIVPNCIEKDAARKKALNEV